jgi:hypothetical protein
MVGRRWIARQARVDRGSGSVYTAPFAAQHSKLAKGEIFAEIEGTFATNAGSRSCAENRQAAQKDI